MPDTNITSLYFLSLALFLKIYDAFSIKSLEVRSSLVVHNSTAFAESFIDTLIKSPSSFIMLFYEKNYTDI